MGDARIGLVGMPILAISQMRFLKSIDENDSTFTSEHVPYIAVLIPSIMCRISICGEIYAPEQAHRHLFGSGGLRVHDFDMYSR